MITVAIQAGGESRRMGSDKALLPFLGEPLIQRVIKRVMPIADETFVVTNNLNDYRFLDLPLYTDLLTGKGALGGLYTALYYARNPIVAVVACDMPFVCADLLVAESELIITGGWDAIIPRILKGSEPFHAVYRRDSCIPVIEAVLREGHLKVDAWFNAVQIRYLTSEEVQKYDVSMLAFWNINTPDELIQAEYIASRERTPK